MSSSQQHQQQGAFSLFPNPNSSKPIPPPAVVRLQTPRPRRSESRERRAYTPQPRAPTPQRDHQSSYQSSPARSGRATPQQHTSHTPADSDPAPRHHGDSFESSPPQVQQPRHPADVPLRTETAFSEANTLVRSNSNRSRRSIAKPPLYDNEPASSSAAAQPQQIRSIFPTYNPNLPMDQQDYAPTQMSPTHIPRAVISRQSYYDDSVSTRGPLRSPRSPPTAPGNRFQGRSAVPMEPPVVPKTCTTEQLKDLWKVTNGWKASPSEGRVYCLKMTQHKDSPSYMLSSATQPFYNLRLDPTSASANVTICRHDPHKTYKGPKVADAASSSSSSVRSGMAGSGSGRGSSSGKALDKNWQEVLSTKLEEPARRLPPNDGLVADLMPTPAARMAMEKANDAQAVAMAENECARLVWDNDTENYFLVHGALAAPFCVTVERCPAWARVEYTLEHHESRQHMAKLTRDGTGAGWLELDTTVASQIESFYILDVAVTALLLVAQADEKNAPASAESFEPPPPPPAVQAERGRRVSSRLSGGREEKLQSKRRKMEEFDIDIESQDGSLGKGSRRSRDHKVEDKLPFLLRVVVKLTKAAFKCVVWVLTIAFKCFSGVFKVLYSCVGSKY